MNIILLNGPSSAGKSTISYLLKEKLKSELQLPFQIITIDDYIKMSPDEPIWEDDVFETTTPMGKDIQKSVQLGKGVIIDHVITSERIFNAIVEAAKDCQLYKVQVTCKPEVLRAREITRGNRFVGSAQASLQYLHPKEGYDVTVDTSEISSKEAANLIYNELF